MKRDVGVLNRFSNSFYLPAYSRVFSNDDVNYITAFGVPGQESKSTFPKPRLR